MLASLACFGTAVRPRASAVVSVCASSILGTALFLFAAIVPAYRAAQPTEELLDHIARERVFAPDLRIAVCDDTLRLQRDILFTLRMPVIENCELWAVVSSPRKFLIIVTSGQEKSLHEAHVVVVDIGLVRVGNVRGLQIGALAQADPGAEGDQPLNVAGRSPGRPCSRSSTPARRSAWTRRCSRG